MTKTKKRIFWSAGIVGVLLIGWLIFGGGEEESIYETEPAVKKDVEQTVSVTGELKSESEINVNFEGSGRIARIDVKIGQTVARGETIATVDDALLNSEVDQAKAGLDQAVALAGANSDAIREAEEAVDNAKDFLEETDDLEDQKVDAAELSYDNAKDYYEVVKNDGSATDSQKKAAENAKKEAKEYIETAKKARDLAKISAENSVDSAEERLTTAKSQYTRSSNDASVAQARAVYDAALTRLSRATLISPLSGVITEVNYKEGEVLGSASLDMASSSSGFVEMIASDFVLEVDVPESDITKVKLDQKAEVTFDALDESEVFEASIVEVDPSSTVIADVVYYRVKLRMDSFDPRLKSGMSADIDIFTAKREDVIVVPARAISDNEQGKKVVKVLPLDSTEAIEKVIEIGLRGDDGEVEITSGISVGEQVIVLEKKQE